MRAVMEEEEENADNEFWNQEFFLEEEADEDYQEEVEEVDVVDSDFDDSVSAGLGVLDRWKGSLLAGYEHRMPAPICLLACPMHTGRSER